MRSSRSRSSGRSAHWPRFTTAALLGVALAASHTNVASADAPSDQTHRQYGPWFSAQLGGGGYWLDTQPSASVDDRWYVWSDVGGIYRSDDDANTWHALHQHFPDDQGDVTNIRALHEHPQDPDRLVAFTGTRWRPTGGIWTSDDAGQSWTKQLDGRFWGNAQGREFGRTLSAHPTDPAKLVAAGQDGVVFSNDFGRTWTPGTGLPNTLNPAQLMHDPTNPDRLWLSSWRLDEWSLDGKFDAADGTFESLDGGRTWQKLNNLGVKEVVADPSNPTRWIGSFDNELRQTTDGGRTWSRLMNGAPGNNGAPWEVNTQHFPALATTDNAVIAANGQGDIYQLPAGQSRWQRVNRTHVDAPDWWYGNTGHNDSHENWVHFGKSASSLRVDPDDPDRWLMTDWYAVWETTDAGQTWRFAGDGLENTVLHGVSIDPTDRNHVVVFMGDNGMLTSRDAGRTLDKVQPPGQPLYSNVKQATFAPSDPDVLWVIGNTNPGQWESSAIARSDDAGDTLIYASTQGLPQGMAQDHFAAAIAVDPDDPTAAWVAVSGPVGVGEGGVYATTDNGQTWSAVNDGLPGNVDLFSSNIWDRGPEMAVDEAGTLLAVSKSRTKAWRLDAGDSAWDDAGWLPDAPAAITADPHTPDTWYLATQGKGLYRSDNDGRSWQRVFDQGVADVAVDPNQPGVLVVGAADGVHASADGGATWENVSLDMPHRYFPTVDISDGLIVAGTKGNGVFTRLWPIAAATLPGDFDGDGQVAQGDLDLVLGNWGAATKPEGFVANLDGLTPGVDQDELDAVLGGWGQSTSPAFDVATPGVPEPASAVVVGVAASTLLRR